MSKGASNRRLRRDNEQNVREKARLEELVAGKAFEEHSLRREVRRRQGLERSLRASNRELEDANEQLERVNAELDSFAYALSHDLQAPLRQCASLLTFLEEDQEPPLNEAARGHMQLAIKTTDRMSKMIRGVLDYARAREHVEGTSVQLDAVLGEVCESLGLAIEQAEGTVEVGQLPQVTGHRVRIVQLFQNLIQNAINYRADRPLVIEVVGEAVSGGVRISVQDNGMGMEPRMAEEAFRLFRRINVDVEGSGIGLALCKQIAESHGGSIAVETEVGVGTTFHVTLPSSNEE